MRVIADSREPGGLIAALRAAAGAGIDGSPVEIEIEALDVGDFLIGPGAAVERKTGADFVASILDGRFAEQAAKLRATYERVFWLVEGDGPFIGDIPYCGKPALRGMPYCAEHAARCYRARRRPLALGAPAAAE